MGRVIVAGVVAGIFVADEANGPCRSLDRAEAIAGVGLAGDRYAQGVGTFSRGGTGRQLTLIAQESLDALANDGVVLGPGEARRNIETIGVDLDSLVGRRFRVGPVECLGVRTCPPCDRLEALTTPGVQRGLERRGGLRADIVTNGMIVVGDAIACIDEPEP